jgi:hypothetical protein
MRYKEDNYLFTILISTIIYSIFLLYSLDLLLTDDKFIINGCISAEAYFIYSFVFISIPAITAVSLIVSTIFKEDKLTIKIFKILSILSIVIIFLMPKVDNVKLIRDKEYIKIKQKTMQKL